MTKEEQEKQEETEAKTSNDILIENHTGPIDPNPETEQIPETVSNPYPEFNSNYDPINHQSESSSSPTSGTGFTTSESSDLPKAQKYNTNSQDL